MASRGFLGGATQYDFAVPDLAGTTGFTAFWNLRRGSPVKWTVTGGEGDPGSAFETYCMLSGICPVIPVDGAVYYGGYTQKDVKPTPDSLLLKLGMEKAPPIVTSAVLLDAKTLVGGGQPMKAGELVTAKHIEAMLKAQGLARRGILPGDVVYVRTGWGDFWKDPDTEKFYYTKAPGLSYDAAIYLGERRIVAIGLDTPFVDPVPEGMLAGKAGPAPGVPGGLPFALHHHMLTQMGIHHVENTKLDELANDKVWTSCTMILPLLEKGSAGSAIRPVAVGVRGK